MKKIPWETAKYSFFCNRECEYFPCHKDVDPENFNCLFCYCPLYLLGRKCGGRFVYLENGIKKCTDCAMPHIRENYGRVVRRYAQILEMIRKMP